MKVGGRLERAERKVESSIEQWIGMIGLSYSINN